MNHSCVPNCQTQKWIVKSQMRIGIFAIKDIHPNSELTFDYKFELFGKEKSAQLCFCGEATCKGIIGSSKSKKSSINSLETSSEEEYEEEDIDNKIKTTKLYSKDYFGPKGLENPSSLPSLLKKLITIESIGPLRHQLQILNVRIMILKSSY